MEDVGVSRRARQLDMRALMVPCRSLRTNRGGGCGSRWEPAGAPWGSILRGSGLLEVGGDAQCKAGTFEQDICSKCSFVN